MRPAVVTAICLILASCGRGDGPVTVRNATVSLPAVAGRPGAAYFEIESKNEARLVGVTSAAAGRIELHEEGMRPAASFALIPGEPLRFRPGGRHAMLFGLDPALRPGRNVTLTFRFEGGLPPVTAEARVHAPGDVPTHR